MIINLDVDGVLRDFWSSASSIIMKEFDLKSTEEIKDNHIKYVINNYPKEVFFCARPYPEAIELAKMLERKHNVIIVSHQNTMGGILYTNLWLDKYGITKDRIFVEKIEQKASIPGDVIIDDNPEIIELCKSKKKAILIRGVYSPEEGVSFKEACCSLEGGSHMETKGKTVSGFGPWKI